jgi:hypothetical protein
VRLDVIGVPVPAAVVVGDHDLRPHVLDHLGQQRRRGRHRRRPERPRRLVRRQPHHAAVAEPPGSAEEPVVGHAQRRAGPLQLDDPVTTELVRAAGSGEPGQRRHQDLALLAERAGDQRDRRAGRDVTRHGGATGDRLVVRVGVDEQQPPRAQMISCTSA